jgi:hypothetical protein
MATGVTPQVMVTMAMPQAMTRVMQPQAKVGPQARVAGVQHAAPDEGDAA